MSKRIEFSLAQPTLSLNQYLKMHWTKRRKHGQMLQLAVKTLTAGRTRPNTKQKVTIKRYGFNELDHDNLVGGCKPLLDALKKERLIVDDNPDWVDVTYEQEIDRKNTRTDVLIEEA